MELNACPRICDTPTRALAEKNTRGKRPASGFVLLTMCSQGRSRTLYFFVLCFPFKNTVARALRAETIPYTGVHGSCSEAKRINMIHSRCLKLSHSIVDNNATLPAGRNRDRWSTRHRLRNDYRMSYHARDKVGLAVAGRGALRSSAASRWRLCSIESTIISMRNCFANTPPRKAPHAAACPSL